MVRILHFLLRVMTDLFYYSSGRAANASAACLRIPRRGIENSELGVATAPQEVMAAVSILAQPTEMAAG